MRRRRLFGSLTMAAAFAAVGGPGALASVSSGDARIAGRVIECNAPDHCFTNSFSVSAIDSQGRTVATVLTRGKNNGYMLHVQPATYQLVAELSGGLRCEATAVALAHQTVRQNIICPIP